jgi:hypothetical protein
MKNLLLFLFSFTLAGPAISQSKRIGQHDAITSWKETTNSFASAAEGKQIGQQIIDVVGLKPNFEVIAANVPNAAAVVYSGKRYVLYNPTFINNLIRTTGTQWAAVSVLAHEIGHHLNGHTLAGTGNSHQLELDADEFSGFALRKMGANLAEAQAAMNTIASDRASRTHPGQQDRLVAIQRGWNQADDQMNGRDVARTYPQPRVQQPSAQPQRQTTVATRRSQASTSIIGDVRFNSDPNSSYYVTSQYNVVKVVNNRMSVVGKLATLNNSRFPYIIYDEAVKLYVDRAGRILSQRGQQVGSLRARA